MQDVIAFLLAHGVDIGQGLLQILGGFALIAKITPTTADDKIIAAILKVVSWGSLNLKPAAKVEAAKEIVEAGIATPSQVSIAVSAVKTEQVEKAIDK